MNIYVAEKLVEDEMKKLEYVNQNGWKYSDRSEKAPKMVHSLLYWLGISTR